MSNADDSLGAYKRRSEEWLASVARHQPTVSPTVAQGNVPSSLNASNTVPFSMVGSLPSFLSSVPRHLLPTLFEDYDSGNKLPTRHHGDVTWYMRYRPAVHPTYCSHPIHTCSDGIQHPLTDGEPSIFLPDHTTQSADCWASIHRSEGVGPQISSTTLRMGDYGYLGILPPTTTLQFLGSLEQSASGYKPGFAKVEMPLFCSTDHTAVEKATLSKDNYGWVGKVNGKDVYMCRDCMAKHTELNDQDVFTGIPVSMTRIE